MPKGERQDFPWHSGNDLDLDVTVYDQADAVFSLSGATAVTWQLGRLALGSVPPAPSQPGRPLITKNLTSGVEFLALSGGASGATIHLTSGDGAPLRGGDYYHEMEIDFDGKHTTTLFGIVTVLEDL